MTEYISREDAERALLERCKETGYGGLTPDDIRLVMRTPWRIPTADVVERKKGKWYRVSEKECLGDINCQCSECAYDDWRTPTWWKTWANYCPQCGAEMRCDDDAYN